MVFGSEGLFSSISQVVVLVEEMGYFVMIKVIVGGGGCGMCLVLDVSQFESLYKVVQGEVEVVFGNFGFYMEKFIDWFCYVEVQVLVDCYGNVVYFGERDCLIQCCYQKLLEEVLSLVLDFDLCCCMGDVVVVVV